MARQTTMDRFGNPTMVVGLKIPNGKEYGRGFVEIKGELYKLEVTNSNKEGVQAWVRVTKLKKREQNRGGGF